MKDEHKGVLAVFFSAIIWGFIYIFSTIFVKMNISPIEQVFFKSLFAIPMLIPILYYKGLLKIHKQHLSYLFIFGFFMAIVTFFEFSAVGVGTPAATTNFIITSFPLFTIIFSHYLLKERVSIRKIESLFFVLLGVFLIAQPWTANTLRIIGVLFALLGALGNGYYIVFVKKLIEKYHYLTILFWASVFTFVSTPIIWILSYLFNPFTSLFTFSFNLTAESIILLLLFAFLYNVLAYLLIMYGTKFLLPSKTSLILSFESVFALIFAFIILAEVPDIFQLVGGLFILIGIWIIAIRKKTVEKEVKNIIHHIHRSRHR